MTALMIASMFSFSLNVGMMTIFSNKPAIANPNLLFKIQADCD